MATYYTATTGNDSNAGTIGSPFLTVNKGVSVLTPGDTLLIRAGTYAEALVQPSITGTDWTTGLITIAAYQSETVWLKPVDGSCNWVLDLQSGQRYLNFDGVNLDATNATTGNDMGGMAVSGADNSHHIRLQNCEILGSKLPGDLASSRVGIVLNGNNGFNEITNVEIHRGGAGSGDSSYYGIYVHSSDNVMDGLNIYAMGAAGIQIYNSSNPLPARNVVKNCRIHDIIQSFDTRRVGILVTGDDHLIYNNIIYNINEDSSGPDTIAVVNYTGTGNQYLNNTVTDNHGLAFYIAGSAARVANCISFANDTNTITNVGTGTITTTNLIGTDPVFVNAAIFDYALQASSPAINVGTTFSEVPFDIIGTPRPQGSAYDIGAYEYILSPLVPQTLIYVATTGSDTTGNGTITNPFGTLRFAVAQLTAGKTLYIRGGTYTGAENTINSTLGTVASGTNFTTGAITITAYPNETVILTPPDGSTGIELGGGQHHLIVQDVTINMINNTTVGSGPDGVFLNAASHHNRFLRITVKNNSSSGFRTSKGGGSPDNNEFLSCISMDNGRLAETNSGVGFYIFSDSTTVQDCIITGNNGSGVVVGGDADPQYVSANNTITGNRIAGNFVHGTDTGAGSASYGVFLTYTDTTMVTNNVIVDNQGGVYLGAGSDADVVYNNTITTNSRNVGGLLYPILMDGYASAPTLDSNIVFNNGNNSGNVEGGIQDNGGTGTPVVVHNTVVDPIFVNPPVNLNLDPSSPAIGTGAPVPVVPIDYYGVAQPTPSDGGAIVYTPTPITTTTTIGTVTPTSPVVTQTYTVEVTVAPTSGSSTPSGSVTLNDGVGHVVTAPVTTSGPVVVPMPAPATAQTVTLTATFSGLPAPFSPSNDTASVTISSPSGPIPSPPTNISFATALDIGELDGFNPIIIEQNAYTGVLTADLFFSYQPVDGDDVLLVYGHGDGVGGGALYRPTTTVWYGPAGAPTQIGKTSGAFQTPMQVDIVTGVTPGEPIFFKVVKAFGLGNPSDLTLRIARAPKDDIAAGDLFINDSGAGYPGVVMVPTTAVPKRYQLDFPAGEGVCTLTNGVVSVVDATDGPSIWNVTSEGFTLRATPTGLSAYDDMLATNQIDTFWAGDSGARNIIAFDQDGVISGVAHNVGVGGLGTITPSLDGTKVYFGRSLSTANLPVLMITIATDVVTTFVAGVATKFFGANFLTMTDDTLLIPYEKAATDTLILHYDDTATLLHTFTLTGVQNQLERIFADDEDPTYFWVWWQTATENRFQKIKVSDGSIVTDLTRMKFVEGVSEEGETVSSTIYSGADFSCVPIVLRTVQDVPDTGTPGVMRRMRRFLLPSSEDNEFMNIPTLELLMRTGIGLTKGPADDPNQGENPQVMLRLSTDGGKTWSNERWRSAGYLGQYLGRVRWLQATGRYRNALVEVTVTDPVDWQLLSMSGKPRKGNS